MDKEMDKEREILHKALDGDADEADKKLIAQRMDADLGFRVEATNLLNTIRALEEGERREPPASFTADVMRRLPATKPSVLRGVREFLFGSRMLRWNMATALAMAVVLVAVVAVVSRMPRQIQTAEIAPVSAESAVTVRLVFHDPGAHTVAVAGNFNKWRTDADEMKKSDGAWTIDLKLTPGVYTYSFIVDGKSWVTDPGAKFFEDDGFGSRNAVLRVNI